MNLIQLQYFQAVCTFHTVSDAAQYLHISQPSLSSAIKELEKEFGVALFTRHHRGMALTPEGESLYAMSQELLSMAAHTEKIMKDLGREKKKLRLGVPPMIGSLILPDVYRRFLPENPDIELDIVEGGRQELLKKLSENAIDMAFLAHNRMPEEGITFQRVGELEIVFCTSKEHPLSACRTVTPEELKNVPLVLFDDTFFQTEKIMQWFKENDVTPKILMQTAQLSNMLCMMHSRAASGFMFKELVLSDSQLVSIPLKRAMYVDVSLVWKKDAYVFDGMKRFKEYSKQAILVNHKE